MKIIVLGAAGRMGSMHARHLMEMGHEAIGIDPLLKSGWIESPIEHWRAYADAIVIATPAQLHAMHLHQAILAGYHVFIEKPICLIDHLPACRQALAEAKEQGTIIAVGYNLRFHPQVMAVRDKITSGALRPLWGSFLLRQKPQRPIGHLWEEWYSHEVDLALHLFGDARQITKSLPAPDGLELMIDQQKAVSFIHADAYTEPPRRAFTIVDQDGVSVTCDIEADHVQEAHYKAELQAWLDLIQLRYRGDPPDLPIPLATGEDGLAIIDLLERISR